MSRMQAALAITVALLVCVLIAACAYGLVHDGTTPAPPSTTWRTP